MTELAAAIRARTAAALGDLLRFASPALLQKLAVDLVPPLMRVAGYTGIPLGTGDRWGDALAQPRIVGLPPVLVRIHAGAWLADDTRSLAAAMQGANATQAALAVIADDPLTRELRDAVAAYVPWLLDRDGLVNLMLSANVGVAVRAYEAKYPDEVYFR